MQNLQAALWLIIICAIPVIFGSFDTKFSSSCRYHLLQLFFSIFLFNGDLTISFESFVELVSDVPFHAVCSKNITDTADMSPRSEIPKCFKTDQQFIPKETHSQGQHHLLTGEKKKKSRELVHLFCLFCNVSTHNVSSNAPISSLLLKKAVQKLCAVNIFPNLYFLEYFRWTISLRTKTKLHSHFNNQCLVPVLSVLLYAFAVSCTTRLSPLT